MSHSYWVVMTRLIDGSQLQMPQQLDKLDPELRQHGKPRPKEPTTPIHLRPLFTYEPRPQPLPIHLRPLCLI